MIDEQTRADYQRDGAVCVRGHFDREWLDLLTEGAEQNFADPGDPMVDPRFPLVVRA